jgi:heme exporter protein A
MNTNRDSDTGNMSSEPALQVQGLSKVFGARTALSNIAFELPEGSFLSIFGPNGAGKTTLLRILATLARASSGTARLLGYDLREQAEEIRSLIGYVSHRSMLYLDLTAEENLRTIAELYGMGNPSARVTELLNAVELTARSHDLVRTFSRGMTQRLAIARALICDPRLLFLDEPYSGLDPHASDILDALLSDARTGRTLIMVSHDLTKGFELATHLLLLERGKLLVSVEKSGLSFASFSSRYRQTVSTGIA